MKNTVKVTKAQVGNLTLALLLWTVGGCGGPKPPKCDKAELLALNLEPQPVLNPDREGNPRSVVVRVYQLAGADAFQAATFEELWQSSSKTSDTVVGGPDELTLIPGRRETHSFKRNPQATHLAMTANFREYHPESEWKAWVELPQAQDPCSKNAPKVAAQITAELVNYALRLR